MFLEERYEKIIKKIESDGRVAVKSLAVEFDVTEDCIRKDLRELEKQGKLKRVYGGAIAARAHLVVKGIDERRNINLDKKKKIAQKAVELIEDEDIIFLDTSTINLEIAKRLEETGKRVTVVTNMIEVLLELKKSTHVKLICVGGQFNPDVGAGVGAAADRYIKNFIYDKAFIGVCGINKETGSISTLLLEDGTTKKTIMECSTQSYLVMEKKKFQYDEFYKFATLDDITAIITEDDVM